MVAIILAGFLTAMLGRDRGDRGALVALTILVAGVVVVAWLGNPSDSQITQPGSYNIDQQQGGDVANPVASSNQFDPWRDSYAQWMMAILSIVATGVSALAVWLVRSTLDETRRTTKAAFESNQVAREIGQAQVRAYLDFVSASVVAHNINDEFLILKLRIVVSNSGASPAQKLKLSIQLFPFFTFPDLKFEWHPVNAKMSNKSVSGHSERIIEGESHLRVPIFRSGEDPQAGRSFMMPIKVEYIDVFGGANKIIEMFAGTFTVNDWREMTVSDGSFASIYV